MEEKAAIKQGKMKQSHRNIEEQKHKMSQEKSPASEYCPQRWEYKTQV